MLTKVGRHSKRLVGFLLVGALAVCCGVAAPDAKADDAVPCTAPMTQPFLRWLDPAWYVFAGDGGFEQGGRGWTLTGARVTTGNEPFTVHAVGDSHALTLAAGTSATSPPICIATLYPTVRLFARHDGLVNLLAVDAIVNTGSSTITVPIPGVATVGSGWTPTTLGINLPLLFATLNTTSTTSIRLRFKATSSWQIDDIYVDPFKGH